MEPVFTKWEIKPFFLLFIDFIFSETMSTCAAIDILIGMPANLRIFFDNLKNLMKSALSLVISLTSYVLEVFRG